MKLNGASSLASEEEVATERESGAGEGWTGWGTAAFVVRTKAG